MFKKKKEPLSVISSGEERFLKDFETHLRLVMAHFPESWNDIGIRLVRNAYPFSCPFTGLPTEFFESFDAKEGTRFIRASSYFQEWANWAEESYQNDDLARKMLTVFQKIFTEV